MFRKDIKHKEGMGGRLAKLMVNIMMTIQIIQTQATIHTLMINDGCRGGHRHFCCGEGSAIFVTWEESHRIFAVLNHNMA